MKILFVSFVITITVLACSRKTVASKEPVIPRRETLPLSTTNTNNYPVSKLDPAMVNETTIVQGKTLFETKCTRCHVLKNAGDYTEQRWDGILRTMAFRARLTETQTQEVAAFVKANAKK